MPDTAADAFSRAAFAANDSTKRRIAAVLVARLADAARRIQPGARRVSFGVEDGAVCVTSICVYGAGDVEAVGADADAEWETVADLVNSLVASGGIDDDIDYGAGFGAVDLPDGTPGPVFECSRCGSREIAVAARVWVRPDLGTLPDPDADPEPIWDDTTPAVCRGCGNDGTVLTFVLADPA